MLENTLLGVLLAVLGSAIVIHRLSMVIYNQNKDIVEQLKVITEHYIHDIKKFVGGNYISRVIEIKEGGSYVIVLISSDDWTEDNKTAHSVVDYFKERNAEVMIIFSDRESNIKT